MIEINNLTKFAVDKKFLLAVAKRVLKGENKGTENLSIVFVSAKEIQKLNKKYRKKNKPTDVLSFEKISGFKEDLLEVIICPQVVLKRSVNLKLAKKDLAKTLVHGILHCLRYDHEKSKREAELMEKKEEYYLSKI